MTLNHAIDVNVPVCCGDVVVFPGDVLVGDDDGVMVIPANLADQGAEQAQKMELYETYEAEKISKDRSIIGLYPLTTEENKTDFENWEKER